MNPITEALLSLLVLAGGAFTLIGSLSLVRLEDFYTRLHGPTKATTLGVGSLLIASSVFFSLTDEGVSLHEILVTLFLFITAPISAHLLAKVALHQSLPSCIPLPEELQSSEQEPQDQEKSPKSTR
ncbi:MAG: Na+/H+ antiporter subunit G [Desulforhopalus sp.]